MMQNLKKNETKYVLLTKQLSRLGVTLLGESQGHRFSVAAGSVRTSDKRKRLNFNKLLILCFSKPYVCCDLTLQRKPEARHITTSPQETLSG